MGDTSSKFIRIIDHVIGSDKDVANRREISRISEELLQTSGGKMIVIGSFADGVYSQHPGIDIMQEHPAWIACSSSACLQNNNYIRFEMIPSPQNRSYCMLVYQDRHLVSDDVLEYCGGKIYLSSRNVRIRYLSSRNMRIEKFEIDKTPCIACLSWPEEAKEWLSRSRPYGWPDDSLVKKIEETSCHVVAIGLPDSHTNSIEWRLSFSLAERALVHSFNRPQFTVYCILKRIKKDIIEEKVPDVISSYFIKTVLFHTIAATPASMWSLKNLQECLQKCIRILYRFTDDMYCPHYFIRDVNLFESKVNSPKQRKLLSVLRQLFELDLQHLLSRLKRFKSFVKIPRVKDVHRLDIEKRSDSRYNDNMISLFCGFQAARDNKYTNEMLNVLLNILRKSRTTPNNTAAHVSTALYTVLADMIYHSHSNTRNRSQYRVDKLIERFYKLGTKFDVTSGRLRLASFYLINGNISGCLNVIQSVQNRFSPCVRVVNAERRPSYENYYKENMCGRSLSRQQKFHSCISLSSVYQCDDVNIPLAIRYQIWDNASVYKLPKYITSFSPLIHAYFLQALCYIKLRDPKKLENTVQMIRGTIMDDTLCVDWERHDNYNLLGYILMKQDKIGDAVQYHTKSFYSKVKFQRKYVGRCEYNVAVLRIMCCLRQCLHPIQGHR